MKGEVPPEICIECGAPLFEGMMSGTCPRCLAREILSNSEEELIEVLPRRFAGYQLLARIAHGGMGVVYRAKQIELNRIVAVKLLLAGELATREFVHRFRQEAAAAAILQHPNIVAIHEVGLFGGQHFFSMDYVQGCDLARVVGTTPLSPSRAAKIVRACAAAIQFAHERGILHRDLKPSNVIIDPADEPHITDFGLAKRFNSIGCEANPTSQDDSKDPHDQSGKKHTEVDLVSPARLFQTTTFVDADEPLTITGQILGSPGFMPPEQAGAAGISVGPHSDVYSLGAILYHALTARAPFQGETLHQVLRQVVDVDPISPRLLNPAVPVDLDTLCLKALSKEPKNRYPSARELVDELDRYLAGEPTRARPLGLAVRIWRWGYRKPVQATLAAALFLAVLGGVLGISYALSHAKRARLETLQQLSRSYLEQARSNRRSGQSGVRFETLDLVRLSASLSLRSNTFELRNEAVAALALSDFRWVRRGPSRSSYLAIDPSGERYAWHDGTNDIRICRVRDDVELFKLPSIGVAIATWHIWNANGQSLSVPYVDGKVRIWNLSNQQIEAAFPCETHDVVLDMSPGGGLLAIAGPSRVIHVIDLRTQKQKTEFKVPFAPFHMEYSPDGRYLAISDSARAVRVLETDTGTAHDLAHPTAVFDPVLNMAWHPSGNFLVTTGDGQVMEIWDVRDWKSRLFPTEHQGTIIGIACHPNGQLMASTSWDGTTQLWDIHSGKRMATVPRMVDSVRFSRDGKWLVGTFDRSRQVELFEIAAERVWHEFQNPPADQRNNLNPLSVNWTPDEHLICSGTKQGVWMWSTSNGEVCGLIPHPEGYVAQLIPTQNHLLVAGGNAVRMWSLARFTNGTGYAFKALETLSEDGDYYWGASSTSGNTIAYTHQQYRTESTNGQLVMRSDSWVRVWTNGQRAFRFTHADTHGPVAVSPNGKLVGAAERWVSEISLWDASKGQKIWTRQRLPGKWVNLVFTPDSRWLVASTADEFTFYNTESGDLGRRFQRHDVGDFAGPIAFSPDGHFMAFAVTRTLVQLMDYSTGAELVQLESPNPQMVNGLCFSPSSSQLAVVGRVNPLQVWDLKLLRQKLSSMGLDWSPSPLPRTRPSAEVSIPTNLHSHPSK